MHPGPGESVILVDVPILSWKLWKRVIAGSLPLALTDDPIQTEQMLRHLESNVDRARELRDFYFQDLNKTERRVLALLALKGLRNDDLKTQLGCSVKNPHQQHRTKIRRLHPGRCGRPAVDRRFSANHVGFRVSGRVAESRGG